MSGTCPVCSQPYLACIDYHTSEQIGLARLYRHEQYGKVFLHEGVDAKGVARE